MTHFQPRSWSSLKKNTKRPLQSLRQATKMYTVPQMGEIELHSWKEAASRWLSETAHKASHAQDVKNVAWFTRHFGDRYLHEVTRDLIAQVAAIKRDETSCANANRYLAIVKAILRRAAFDWDWLDKPPKIRMFPESALRVRWLTQEQATSLLKELPAHIAEIMRFSLATGLRKSNVSRLEWSQVDLTRSAAWVHADQAKGRRPIPVALNSLAVEVLKRQQGKHPQFVFTYKGKPIGQVSTLAWRKALVRAGITDFRWHDLRHTWASWLAQNGVPLNALQEMGAWRSSEMVRRYAHLAPEQLMRHAKVLDQLWTPS